MRVGVIRHGCKSVAAAVAVTLATFLTPVAAQTPLKLTLDGRIEGPNAPFFVALEQGYFKAEGLDVSIEPSTGGIEPITRVASGAFDIGFGDINALIRYRDQHPTTPLKVVFVVNNRPSYAVIGRKSRGVASLSDLEGKKLGAPVAEPASTVWPAFAKLNSIDPSKVTVVSVGILVREPMLAAGEVDAITGASHGPPISLREKGVPAEDITTLLMADHGLELYGNSIFVNTKVLAEKPDAVRAFLAAFVRGLKDTVTDPSAAAQAATRRNGGSNRDLEIERLQVLIRDSIVTPEVRLNGLGGIDPTRFDNAMNQMSSVPGLKNKPKIGDIFDPAFLPPEADRRIE